MRAINGNNFDLFVTFHEDTALSEYYIYNSVVAHDSGFSKDEDQKIKKHNQKLTSLNVKLFNGIDDPDDPSLGFEFINGYKKFIEEAGKVSTNGMINMWLLANGKAKQTLIPEIPGKLSLKEKSLIVDSFFVDILCYH